jgi:hypothetical protein
MARKALYKHATQVDTTAYPDDGSSPVGSNEWNADPDAQGMLGFTPANATRTISSGVVTPTDSVHVIAAESGTSDDLDKLAIANTSEYDLIYLFADTGDTITLKNTSSPSADGQIKTVSDADETLSTTKPSILIRKGAHWYGYGGGSVGAGSITTAKLANDAVDGTKIADDAINSEHYVDASIDTAHIADDQVTQAKIAAGAVGTTELAADAVDGTKIADDAINSEHYTDGSIDTAHIADDQVTQAKIAAGAVGSTELADDGVTLAKMAGLARGKIIYGDASGNPAALTIGTNGQALKSDGTDLVWGTAGGGNPTSDVNYSGVYDVQDLQKLYLEVQSSSFDTDSTHNEDRTGEKQLYIRTIDSNNEGLFVKLKKNGSSQFVQVG